MLIFIESCGRRSFGVEAVLDCSSFSERQLAEIERAGFEVLFRTDVPGGYCVELGEASAPSAGALLQRCLRAHAAAVPALEALESGDLGAIAALREAVKGSLRTRPEPQPPTLDLSFELE